MDEKLGTMKLIITWDGEAHPWLQLIVTSADGIVEEYPSRSMTFDMIVNYEQLLWSVLTNLKSETGMPVDPEPPKKKSHLTLVKG